MNSVVSYANRGPYGDNKWRGNTSGYIIKDLINQFNVKYFVDICEGSGTSRAVCKEMGIKYTGLDLHMGNDFTKDFVLNSLDVPADMIFSHPPYHDMIKYSGNQWGNEINLNDTSHCSNLDEFLEKSYVMLLNQREATKDNGHYVTLIGDQKKKGVCSSFQADFIKMMPRNELVNVVIKTQHNCQSNNTYYKKSNFISIQHEYLLIWKKLKQSLYQVGWEKAHEYKKNISKAWRSVIRIALMKLGGTARLKDIYLEVLPLAKDLVSKNRNWEAKIRQQLHLHFKNVERGVWAI